ncbi:hypothetical protein COT68_02825 [bacterium (Candidatus Torokbacteria) CG09_land_8_20_14_0_10_42_11]|nr:MAG: hypothetical protein COT68_02825 [bacterium (Candidatus Torokbacteria) CG09_land_8_20_14_0_10_42_11]
MKKNIKIIILAIFLLGLVAPIVKATNCPEGMLCVCSISKTACNTDGACPHDEFCQVERAAFQAEYKSDALKNFITTGLNWFFAIAAFLCIAVIVWAGVTYATAGGDEDKVAKAKKTLLFGLIGIAITISAYAIIQLIQGVLSGATSLPAPTL